MQIQELQTKLDEERECLCLLQQTLKRERATRARGKGLEREHATSIVASSRTGRTNPQSSTEPARTSSPPPCFSATCLSHLRPRGGPVMRFEVSLRLQPCSRPRVLPRGTVGLHQSSLRSPLDTRKRPQFILSPHRKGIGFPCP
jgi:hypothetical protein